MGKRRIRTVQVRKKAEPLHPLRQQPVTQNKPMQSATPQTVYGRVQFKHKRLLATDLRTLQSTLGNRAVQRILARRHEQANIQRTNKSIGQRLLIQRKVNAIRFQDEPTLEEIADGKKVLKQGDQGEAVIRLTTALAELGHYTISVIDEKYDPPLTSAVEKYQNTKGLQGKVVAGAVDKPTFEELDKDFTAAYKVERDVLGKQTAADLLKGTQSLNDAERKAGARAISTEIPVSPITGLPPKFIPEIPGKGKYKDRLLQTVEDTILRQYALYGKGKAAAHADSTKLHDWSAIEGIAMAAKTAADSVFGQYKQGPALKKGVNIMDAWVDKVNQLTIGGKAEEEQSAEWRVRKILTGNRNVKELNREHSAIQARSDEKLIVDDVKNSMIAKHRAKLLDTHKGWPGYADRGQIFIQLFKGDTVDKQKGELWHYYQTFIHEYIHTLEHRDHVDYRKGVGEQKGGFTLREGTTDYFTKIVWNSIIIDDALRKKIEGPINDPAKKFPIPLLNTYGEAENAERLAGVVGIRNLAAAFFLGKVELIGKK